MTIGQLIGGLSLGVLILMGAIGPARLDAVELAPGGRWWGDANSVKIRIDPGKNKSYAEDAPTINTKLFEHSRKMEQAVYEIVKDKVYLFYGYDLASPMMVVGDDGVIIVDVTMDVENGKEVMKVLREITDKPIRAVVYTHNHIDHVGGIRAFVSEEDVRAGKVQIYAHETLPNAVSNWASNLGPILGVRSSYSVGGFLKKGPEGSVNEGIGPTAGTGTITFIQPTVMFSDELDVEVAGVKMQLRYLPSETNDEIVAWFPDLKVLNSAEVIQGESYPNVHSIRGTRFRDPVKWFKSIDVLRSFPAEYMVPTHGRPVVGHENIQNVLTAYRDAIQYVHDQTIRHMNRGLTPDELVEVVELPQHLADHPWLGEFYGTVHHAVKQIYNGYLGWFLGDPAELAKAPYKTRARNYVDLMGGRDKVLAAAKKAVDDKEYGWAAELLTWVIRLDPDDQQARNLKAQALRQFGYEQTSINWRNWAITSALELEGQPLQGGFGFTSPDVLRSFPSGKIVEMMTTRLDPEKSLEANETMGIYLPDTNEGYGLEVRRGVAQFHDRFPKKVDIGIVLNRPILNEIMLGGIYVEGEGAVSKVGDKPYRPLQGLLAAIEKGDAKVIGGTKADIEKFFSYFDPPDAGDIKLTVR